MPPPRFEREQPGNDSETGRSVIGAGRVVGDADEEVDRPTCVTTLLALVGEHHVVDAVEKPVWRYMGALFQSLVAGLSCPIADSHGSQSVLRFAFARLPRANTCLNGIRAMESKPRPSSSADMLMWWQPESNRKPPPAGRDIPAGRTHLARLPRRPHHFAACKGPSSPKAAWDCFPRNLATRCCLCSRIAPHVEASPPINACL